MTIGDKEMLLRSKSHKPPEELAAQESTSISPSGGLHITLFGGQNSGALGGASGVEEHTEAAVATFLLTLFSALNLLLGKRERFKKATLLAIQTV